MTNSIPKDYLALLTRIETVEKKLSSLVGVSAEDIRLSDHAEEDTLDYIDATDIETSSVPLVKITSKAYLKMALHAKKYANDDIKQKKWVEVIGLMTGHVQNEGTPMEQLVVKDAWPVGHGDAVSVSIMESRSFTDIIQKLSKSGSTDFICGWYHSHPSYGPFLSEPDYLTQARYQSLWEKSIALVIDPTQISESDYGFGVFMNTKSNATDNFKQSYTEISSIVDGLETEAANSIITLIQPALSGRQRQQYFEY